MLPTYTCTILLCEKLCDSPFLIPQQKCQPDISGAIFSFLTTFSGMLVKTSKMANSTKISSVATTCHQKSSQDVPPIRKNKGITEGDQCLSTDYFNVHVLRAVFVLMYQIRVIKCLKKWVG